MKAATIRQVPGGRRGWFGRRRAGSSGSRGRRILTALGLLGACLLAGGALADLPAEWLVVEDPPGPVDAAVVLAGDPGWERTETAARLVLGGEARLLVLTGAGSSPGDSAVSLRARALELGVPPERIRMETISRNTREELLAVRPILLQEGARRVALVTSPYHQRRAYLAACRAWPGIAISNRPASPSSFEAANWWKRRKARQRVVSEYTKLLYYFGRGWLGLPRRGAF